MVEPNEARELPVVEKHELKPIHLDAEGKAKIEKKPKEDWTWWEWEAMTRITGGADDPKEAEMMREARKKAQDNGELEKPPKMPIYFIRYNGQVVHPDEVAKMTDGELRELHVGTTCTHFNSDVPGMSDFH